MGPTRWRLTEIKIEPLSAMSSITHIMLIFSSYRNQSFGLHGKCTGCKAGILTLNWLNKQTNKQKKNNIALQYSQLI